MASIRLNSKVNLVLVNSKDNLRLILAKSNFTFQTIKTDKNLIKILKPTNSKKRIFCQKFKNNNWSKIYYKCEEINNKLIYYFIKFRSF